MLRLRLYKETSLTIFLEKRYSFEEVIRIVGQSSDSYIVLYNNLFFQYVADYLNYNKLTSILMQNINSTLYHKSNIKLDSILENCNILGILITSIISYSFIWRMTKEGDAFWRFHSQKLHDIAESIKNRQIISII